MAVKKAQAVRIWREVRETTELNEVLKKYHNKPGYTGKRTLQRYALADRGFRDCKPLEQLAREIGWSTSYLKKIHAWWQQEFGNATATETDPEDAQRAVFDLYDQGQTERAIVKSVKEDFQSHEKTIRRCIAGLNLLTAEDGGQGADKARFVRLDGTPHYLEDLRRSYRAHRERVRGSAVDGPLHQHQQDLLGEAQRLKETVLLERWNPLRPTSGIVAQLHDALRRHTQAGELPDFLDAHATALKEHSESHRRVAMGLKVALQNLRQKLPVSLDIWPWDQQVLDTLDQRTRHARPGRAIPEEHQGYDHDPKVDYNEPFIPSYGEFQMTQSAIIDADYHTVYDVHVEFREIAEQYLSMLQKTAQELNRSADSLVDALDILLLSHQLPGRCQYCSKSG